MLTYNRSPKEPHLCAPFPVLVLGSSVFLQSSKQVQLEEKQGAMSKSPRAESYLQHFRRACIDLSQDWEGDYPTARGRCNLTFLFSADPCWSWVTAKAATSILVYSVGSDGIWAFSPGHPGRAVWLGTLWKGLENMLQLVGHIHNAKMVNMKRCCHASSEKTDPVAHVTQVSLSK